MGPHQGHCMSFAIAGILQRFCRKTEIPERFATDMCSLNKRTKPLFFVRKSLLYLTRGHCTVGSKYVAKRSNTRQQNQIRSTVYSTRFA